MQWLGKENLLEDYHSKSWRAGKQLIALYIFRSSWVNKTSTWFFKICDMEYSVLFSGEVPKRQYVIYSPHIVSPGWLTDVLHFSKANYDSQQLKVHFANVQ